LCGHLETAQWLYQLGKQINSEISIHANDEYAFRCSCLCGHLEIAQWLCTLDNRYQIKEFNGKIIQYHIGTS
jgi:hypothetical protein